MPEYIYLICMGGTADPVCDRWFRTPAEAKEFIRQSEDKYYDSLDVIRVRTAVTARPVLLPDGSIVASAVV